MPSYISKKRRLPFFVYSEQWPADGVAPSKGAYNWPTIGAGR